MNILVFNCGSSSLKYRLLGMPGEEELAGGEAQRVGPPTAEPARIIHRENGVERTVTVEMPDQATALSEVMKLLSARADLRPDAFGHRVVHGGTKFAGSALLTDRSVEELRELEDLAPLHNPPAMQVIDACRASYPEHAQFAVFDTAYHTSIPARAHTYALPADLRNDLGIRKYGFHGTSHRYVVQEAASYLGKAVDGLSAVSIHLGSGGASLCAVINGKSVDNTLGYSPLQGLMMSTRCGDLDPAVALRLLNASGSPADVESLLNKRSGVLGMSGASADIRDVLKSARGHSPESARAALTSTFYLWRLRKYLGAYLATVGDTDAVIFTDTIGETVPEVRLAACSGMEAFGLEIDAERNERVASWPADVAAPTSGARILVIRTNEELAIARDVFTLSRRAA
jgi:acetate kinase